jgi:hypothetical protein
MSLATCFAFVILLLVSAQAALTQVLNDPVASRLGPRLNTIQFHSVARQSETGHSFDPQSREGSKPLWVGVPEFQPVDDGLGDDDSSSGPGASLAEADCGNIPKDWRLSRPDPQRPTAVTHLKENPPP